MRRWLLLIFIPILIGTDPLGAGPVDYKVYFLGLEDNEALKSVKRVSFLTSLQEKKPASINALRYRAESDIPDILKALHAHGYYDAMASIQIVNEGDDVEVFVMLQPGTVYTIESFEITLTSNREILQNSSLTLPALEIILKTAANAVKILNAEQRALTLLSQCGYPLAYVLDRRVVADYATKTVAVYLKIEAADLSKFGPTKIAGAPHIKKQLFKNKQSWTQGEVYDTLLVEATQKKLLDTALFSSVVITHDNTLNTSQQLPMKIEVVETKHKSINLGASYQTFFGPGVTFGWENRNIAGLGRTLSLKGDVTARAHTGTATFFVPDWWKVDQDYVCQTQALQESVYAYHQQSYHLTHRIERRIDTKYRVSAGQKLERILVTNSVSNGSFNLHEMPLYFRFSSANHLLDPTQGRTIEVKLVPSANFTSLNRYYFYTSVTYASYFPMTTTHFFVLAQQLMVDSIWSSQLNSIPVPKRVLGGSDEDLRGYRFKTVSPLDRHHKPIGGRFGLFYTLEGRFRLGQTIGIVPFFDLGRVELSPFPKWRQKWYKSAGIGFRYFTFLGPIRFDVAFPLEQRQKIDAKYRLLVSIGQTF